MLIGSKNEGTILLFCNDFVGKKSVENPFEKRDGPHKNENTHDIEQHVRIGNCALNGCAVADELDEFDKGIKQQESQNDGKQIKSNVKQSCF